MAATNNYNYNVILHEALVSASWVHANQLDKAGQPYILHPLAVAHSVRDDIRAFVLAILHDTLEDGDINSCGIIRSDLRVHAPDILEALEAITHRKGESNEEYWRRCRENPLALKVKLADIAHNTSSERLEHLPEETRTRLIKKYTRAKEVLLENHGK